MWPRLRWFLLLIILLPIRAMRAQSFPNILIFLTDDQSFGDISPYNNQAHTPHIQSIADNGTLYARFYTAMSWCIPTRWSLLTGLHPARLIDPGHATLPDQIDTLPEILRARGYRTGISGKWHLGELPENSPLEHGFDYYYEWPTHPDNPKLKDKRYTSKRFTDGAFEFLQTTSLNRPFFLYVAYSAPHTFHYDPSRERAIVGIDQSIGQILDEIKQRGQLNNTMIIFLADNGIDQHKQIDPITGQGINPWADWLQQYYPEIDLSQPGHWDKGHNINHFDWQFKPPEYDESGNITRQTGKGSVYEAGVRISAIISWPGQTEAYTDYDLRYIPDIYYSIVGRGGDGQNLTDSGHPRLIFYNHPNQATGGLGAIIEDGWKYHFFDGALYNDLSEKTDVSAQYPAKVQEMRQKALAFDEITSGILWHQFLYAPMIFNSPVAQ